MKIILAGLGGTSLLHPNDANMYSRERADTRISPSVTEPKYYFRDLQQISHLSSWPSCTGCCCLKAPLRMVLQPLPLFPLAPSLLCVPAWGSMLGSFPLSETHRVCILLGGTSQTPRCHRSPGAVLRPDLHWQGPGQVSMHPGWILTVPESHFE